MFHTACLLGLLLCWTVAATDCQGPARSVAAPPASVSAVSPAPSQSSTASPAPPPAGRPSPTEALVTALSRLDSSVGYRYSITSTLSYTVNNQPVEWKYTGQGATAPPDRYEWDLRGPTGQRWHVVGVAGETACQDDLGSQDSGCGLAWGGPSPGSSPYTAIAYLRFAEPTDSLEDVQSGGRDYYAFTFAPALASLGSLDDSHRKVVRQVWTATGTAWVDKGTGALRRLEVSVVSVASSGREQQTRLALTFFDLGQAIDIALPVPGR